MEKSLNENIDIRKAPNAKTGLQELCDYVKRINSGINKIVEIGSYAGNSTEILAKNFKEVVAIDPFENGYDDDNDASSFKIPMYKVEEQFDSLCNKYKNIKKLKMTSKEASKLFKDYSLSIVYIDANHNYSFAKQDILLWLPKVTNNGFIALHDYNNRKHHPGVKVAFDEIFKFPDATFKDTSCIIRKRI